ncbi:MAG: phytanoyl-CoA dioxygenase family protein [Cyanobacteria bacterium]|nr:phytanoyl-CoA dioxygenase family protein [Cyanobacteriota bacterium]
MDLVSKDFWCQFAPELNIEELEIKAHVAALGQEAQDLMIKEGYVQLNQLDLGFDFTKLESVISRLASQELLPVFAFVYDEFWLLQAKFKNILSGFLGDQYKMLPAFWAWHLDPSKQEAGWEPHRDRDRHALEEDGSPLAVTLWIPINEANPMNGCIYLVPANRDRAYNTERESSFDFEYAAVRALPAKPGDALIWNHAILHWGARASERATSPRISIALEYQRGDIKQMKDIIVEPQLLPSFEERLDLIARQIVSYTHMYDFDKSMIEFARGRLKK